MVHHRDIFIFIVLGMITFGFYPKECEGTPTICPADPFDATADAVFLQEALKWGDVDAIINVLTKRVSYQRLAIVEAYRTYYNEEWSKNALIGGDFRDVIVALLTPLPDYYAKELFDAIYSLDSSSSEVIIEILCTQSISGIRETELSYQKLYDRSLVSHLQHSLQRTIYAICVTNRNGTQSVDNNKALSDARILFEAGKKSRSNGEYPLKKFLENSSYDHLRVTMCYYENIAKMSFEEAIYEELSNESTAERFSMTRIVTCIKDEVTFLVTMLHHSMDGLGTDERTLNRIIITRSETDLSEIKEVFQLRYRDTLEYWIRDDTSREYKDILIALVAGCA